MLVQGPSAEVVLKTADKIQLTTRDEFKEKCSADLIYVDYKNITKVVSVGKHVFIDDGLICLAVEHIGYVHPQDVVHIDLQPLHF